MGKAKQHGAKRIMIALATIATVLAGPAVAQDAAPRPLSVQTLIVEAAPDTISRQFFGSVRARETVEMAFDLGGRLVRLPPEEGMRVAAGAVIAELERDGLERAVARVELQHAMAAREAERARALADRATGSATRAEDAETARDLSEVALRDARAALADATLTAPFDAMVAARLIAPQSMVEPGQPVLRLHDMSEVRVEIDLPERVFVAVGGLDRVGFTARTPQGADLPLRLVAFRPDTSRVGQTYLVTLAFLSDPGAALLPGASVTVTATLPNNTPGVAVPASAVLVGNDRSASVFVLDGQGPTATVRRVPVSLATGTGTEFAIEGLESGTEIVAVGAHRLTHGQTVRRFSGLRAVED